MNCIRLVGNHHNLLQEGAIGGDQFVDDGKMIGASHDFTSGIDPDLTPICSYLPALAENFLSLFAADRCNKTASLWWRWPKQGTRGSRSSRREAQDLVEARADQRRQVEDTVDRIGGLHKIRCPGQLKVYSILS